MSESHSSISHWQHVDSNWIVTVDGPIDPAAEKVQFFPRGGGFGKSTDPQTFLRDFRLMSDDELAQRDADFVPFKFGFDYAIDPDSDGMYADEIYHGYTNGRTWNGWAIPRVEKAALLQWVKKTTDDGFQIFDGGTLRFDEDRNALIVTDEDGDGNQHDIVIEPEWINTPDGEKLVWDISLGFCWNNFSDIEEDA